MDDDSICFALLCFDGNAIIFCSMFLTATSNKPSSSPSYDAVVGRKIIFVSKSTELVALVSVLSSEVSLEAFLRGAPRAPAHSSEFSKLVSCGVG
jgi:hypothetical protein